MRADTVRKEKTKKIETDRQSESNGKTLNRDDTLHCRDRTTFRLERRKKYQARPHIREEELPQQQNKSIRTTMRLKWTFWDILGQFGRLYDEFGAF